MVENVNKIPDIYDYEAPEAIREFENERSASRSPSRKQQDFMYDKSHKKGGLMVQSFDPTRETPGKVGGQMHWQIDRLNKSPSRPQSSAAKSNKSPNLIQK